MTKLLKMKPFYEKHAKQNVKIDISNNMVTPSDSDMSTDIINLSLNDSKHLKNILLHLKQIINHLNETTKEENSQCIR